VKSLHAAATASKFKPGATLTAAGFNATLPGKFTGAPPSSAKGIVAAKLALTVGHGAYCSLHHLTLDPLFMTSHDMASNVL
jgi:hypothetical protein